MSGPSHHCRPTNADGSTTKTRTATCPKTLNVTLAGATSSSWATDAIVKLAPTIKTDSDGYKITIEMSSNNNAIAADKYVGGCLAVGTTNPIVCYYGQGKDTKSTPAAAQRNVYTLIPRYTAYKNYTTTTAIASVTAITAAKWNLTYAGSDCSGTAPAATSGGVTSTTCGVSVWLLASGTLTSSASWFQPKEISTKVYTTLTRFSAKESATWTGMDADAKKGASGCAAKALTGASALVAGAAVAFGAAALAF